MCRLRKIALRDYQEKCDYQTDLDRRTDIRRKRDPYVPLCFTGETKRVALLFYYIFYFPMAEPFQPYLYVCMLAQICTRIRNVMIQKIKYF